MKDELDRARSYAYRVLASRPRTRRELEWRLEKKGFSPEISCRILDLLVAYGYIDDRAFALLWVEQRLAKKGLHGLKRELLEKGVDMNIVCEVLEGIDLEAEYDAAMKLVRKKIRLCGGDCPLTRLAGYLERRGFSFEVISRVRRALGEP